MSIGSIRLRRVRRRPIDFLVCEGLVQRLDSKRT
jgi:hypothetical protein